MYHYLQLLGFHCLHQILILKLYIDLHCRRRWNGIRLNTPVPFLILMSSTLPAKSLVLPSNFDPIINGFVVPKSVVFAAVPCSKPSMDNLIVPLDLVTLID